MENDEFAYLGDIINTLDECSYYPIEVSLLILVHVPFVSHSFKKVYAIDIF